MSKILVPIRLLIFAPVGLLLILGTALSILVAPGYLVNPTKVPGVGVRWLRVWWAWVMGDITTWELIK
jgi:hypothetical protein